MGMIYPTFSQRDFGILPVQPNVPWQVESCAWALPGGPDMAVLKAPSAAWAGQDGTDWLRCPVELLDESGLPVWWGYVAGVELEGLCASLDGMYNRVRVDYRFQADSDPLQAWANDLISQEQYGVKELFFDLGIIDHTARAQAVADSWLERTRRPAVTWRSQSAGAVRLRLRGWWHTLGWQFRLWDGEGRRSYETEPAEEGNIGASASAARGAQGFYGPAGLPEWTVSRLRINLRKVGSPGDSLRLSIQEDSSGNPSGLELDAAEIPAGSITTSLDWYEVEFPHLSAALRVGQHYQIVISRSGAVNSTNYYKVGLATPYPVSGALYYRYWNGSTWVQRTPNSIAVHTLWGETTSGKLLEACAGKAAGGQFLNGADVPQEGGRWTPVMPQEVRTFRSEITGLLGLGGADGPWTALVTPGRGLRVLPFSPGTEAGVFVSADGTLTGPDGSPLPPHRVPLGQWARRAERPFAPPLLVQRARLEDGRVKLG